PPAMLTAPAVTGAMQKNVPTSGLPVSPHGMPGEPDTSTVPPMTPLSVKHSRNPTLQVWPAAQATQDPPSTGRLHAVSSKQLRKLSIEQRPSTGPSGQMPSLPPLGWQSCPSSIVEVSSMQAFGAGGSPGLSHAPPGHSELIAQGAPMLEPLMQRLPP